MRHGLHKRQRESETNVAEAARRKTRVEALTGIGKGGHGCLANESEKILEPILEILSRGNTAEVKLTKDGILVLEVRKKIAQTVRAN